MASYTLDNADALASLHAYSTLKPPSGSHLGQIEERIMLVRHWNIQPGEHVLEIGGGQGDCTVVLAAAVGEDGHVTALDPGSLDYGACPALVVTTLTSPDRFKLVQVDPLILVMRRSL
jgi:predicted methyltransferase